MQRSANCPDFIVVYCIGGSNNHTVLYTYVQLFSDYKLHTCIHMYMKAGVSQAAHYTVTCGYLKVRPAL